MIPDVMHEGVLFDASIPIYAVSGPGDRRELSRSFLRRVAAGRGFGYASTEMIREFVHHRTRATGDPKIAAREGRALMSALTILKFDYEVLDTSLELVERLPGLHGRDAVHAATALVYGVPTIASSDPAFDLVPGIARVDPTEPNARQADPSTAETNGAPQR